jgi:hypothetical protein
MIHALVSRSRR